MAESAAANKRTQVAVAVFAAWFFGCVLVAMILQLPGRRIFPEHWYPVPWLLPLAGSVLGATSGLLHSSLVAFGIWRSNALTLGVAGVGAAAGLFAVFTHAHLNWESQPYQYYLLVFVVVTSCSFSLLIKQLVISRQLESHEI